MILGQKKLIFIALSSIVGSLPEGLAMPDGRLRDFWAGRPPARIAVPRYGVQCLELTLDLRSPQSRRQTAS
jgi:hypothetical protein